jgi:hypothetical protein
MCGYNTAANQTAVHCLYPSLCSLLYPALAPSSTNIQEPAPDSHEEQAQHTLTTQRPQQPWLIPASTAPVLPLLLLCGLLLP